MDSYDTTGNQYDEWCTGMTETVKDEKQEIISNYSCQILLKDNNHHNEAGSVIQHEKAVKDEYCDDYCDKSLAIMNGSAHGTIYDVHDSDRARYFLSDGKFDECYFEPNLRKLRLKGDDRPVGYKKVTPEELYCFLKKPESKDLKREREKIVRDFLDQYCDILFQIFKYFLPIDVRLCCKTLIVHKFAHISILYKNVTGLSFADRIMEHFRNVNNSKRKQCQEDNTWPNPKKEARGGKRKTNRTSI